MSGDSRGREKRAPQDSGGHRPRPWRVEGSRQASEDGEPAASEQTRQIVDDEVRRIADECHKQALSILEAHREQLQALAKALLEHETLDEPDAYAAAGIPHAQPAEQRV